MTHRQLSILAQISAHNAVVAGMQAENTYWAAMGQHPAWREADFNAIAYELRELSNQLEAEIRK